MKSIFGYGSLLSRASREKTTRGSCSWCPARVHGFQRGWNRHWVNDRLYSRRPFSENPLVKIIDPLIRRHFPDLVPHIRKSN